MNKILVLIQFLISISSIKSSALDLDENPIVETKYGKVIGSVLETRLKNKFYGFRGIPYARPPIGELRFQAPQTPDPWTIILNATEDASICPQLYSKPPFVTEHVTIDENCLYINVFTKPNFLSNSTLKPVLFYIHDGAYLLGSGSSVISAGPQYLMDLDIVFVSFNYRLAVLGFMALNNSNVPGNAGMKDQVLALRWVQENIEKFGGDKNLVTAFGNSAGAFSIMLHLVSPMSVGLFHRAIMISGASFPQQEFTTHHIELAKKQALLLDCSEVEQVDDIYSCMKNVSALKIPSTLSAMFEFSAHPDILFCPVVEPDFGQERFLIEKPKLSFLNGKMQKIPVMISRTKDEFSFSAVRIIENEDNLHTFDTEFNRVAPISFFYERNTTKSFEVSEALWKAYNLSHPLNKSHLLNINKLFSDSRIGFGIHQFVNLMHNYTDVFLSQFTFQGRYSNFYYPGIKPYGVTHTDDILYVLIRGIAPLFQKDDPEIQKVEQMIRIIYNFALSGNPINKDDDIIGNVNWKPHTYQNHYYLDNGEDFVLKENLLEGQYAIWEKLFPLEKV